MRFRGRGFWSLVVVIAATACQPGTSFSNVSRADNSVANLYIGMDGRHRLDNGFSLVLDMEYSHDLGKVSERAVSGTVRLEYAF